VLEKKYRDSKIGNKKYVYIETNTTGGHEEKKGITARKGVNKAHGTLKVQKGVSGTGIQNLTQGSKTGREKDVRKNVRTPNKKKPHNAQEIKGTKTKV